MNSRMKTLVLGELSRLNKYGVFSVSIFVAFIWGIILFLVNNAILSGLLPFILLLDATLMSVMYIGASMYFEKSESTISTMLVTPVKNSELVLAKVSAYSLHNLASSLLIIFIFYLALKLDYISGITFHLPTLIIGIILSTYVFTVLGLVLSYYQKDFTELLVNMFFIGLLLMIPSILMLFGVIGGVVWENVLIINPLYAAQIIISNGISAEGADFSLGYQYFVSLVYLLSLSICSLYYIAIPKFQAYAIKESGV